MWFFVSIVFYAFLRLFGLETKLGTVLSKVTWTIAPYSWIIFIYSMVCLLLKFILPLLYHYIFYIGVASIFLVIAPIVIQKFYDNVYISPYKLLWAYFLTIFVIAVIWSFNHYNIVLMELV